MSIETTLRETSDTLLEALTRLSALEEEKRQLAPDDPRLVELATEIEAIAEQVLGASAHQRELVEKGQTLREQESPAAPTHSINTTARDLAAILNEWRAAERAASAAAPGSVEQREAEARCQVLRRQYAEAHAQRSRDRQERSRPV